MMCAADPRHGRYLTAAALFRGRMSTKEAPYYSCPFKSACVILLMQVEGGVKSVFSASACMSIMITFHRVISTHVTSAGGRADA